MRVFYELDKEDIRSMIADKFEINIDKVIFKGQGEYVYAQIDMSTTETPIRKEKIDPVVEPDPKEQAPAVFVSRQRKRKPSGYKFNPDITKYEELTNTDIIDMISHNVTVAELCENYGFDQQIKYKLYKRFERARSECASINAR